MKLRSSVTGTGHAYARIRVVYDHTKLRVSDEGRESGLSSADYQACNFAANCVADGFCSGALECTSGMSGWRAPPAALDRQTPDDMYFGLEEMPRAA